MSSSQSMTDNEVAREVAESILASPKLDSNQPSPGDISSVNLSSPVQSHSLSNSSLSSTTAPSPPTDSFADLKISNVELISSNQLTRKDRTFISNSYNWKSVRGKEKWSSGVHEFTFIMKVRGRLDPNVSVFAGIASDIKLDADHMGRSGVAYGNTGDVNSGGVWFGKKTGYNENQKIRIVYDQSTVIFYVENSEVYRHAISGCFVPCVSLVGPSVIEWVD